MQTVGKNIRSWRRRRDGMSQKTLADLAGLSQTYVSQIEAGQRPLDRRSTQAAIANALNVTIPQLLGKPGGQDDPVRSRAELHLPALRSVLVELQADQRRNPRRDVDLLRDEVNEATRLRVGADYASLAARLPDLLLDLAGHGLTLGPQLIEALFCARALLKSLGQHDLAREAAQLGVRIGRDSEDPAWLGEAEYSWIVSFPPQNSDLGARMAGRAADTLQGVSSRSAQETYGHLHLLCALHAATTLKPADAWSHVAEAAQLAASLGEPDAYGPGMGGFNAQWFGPTNLDIWRVGIAAELGDTGTAIDVAERIDLGGLPVPNRWVYYHTDMARALAAGGKDRDAMLALAKAERSAPQHFRFNMVARNLVHTLIERARRRAVAEEFMRLARTLGIDPL